MATEKNRNWEYKIGGRVQGLIPAVAFFFVLGGVTLWLYKTNNGFFIFTGLLAAVGLYSTLASLYHALFIKLLVSRDGFYYQKIPFGGKFCTYSDISKAWISTGVLPNGMQNSYLNFKTSDGKTVRFKVDEDDEDASKLFVKCAEDAYRTDEAKASEKWDGKIDGKRNGGLTGTVFFAIAFAVFAVLTVGSLHSSSIIIPISFGIAAVPLFCILAVMLVRYFCFRVDIGDDGFYFRSNPFDGKFYRYGDIKSFRVQLKSANRRGSGTSYFYYFIFTEKSGKVNKFVFDRSVYEHEIDMLKERIKEHGERSLKNARDAEH